MWESQISTYLAPSTVGWLKQNILSIKPDLEHFQSLINMFYFEFWDAGFSKWRYALGHCKQERNNGLRETKPNITVAKNGKSVSCYNAYVAVVLSRF